TGTVFSDKFKGGDNDGDHGLSPGPLTFHGGAGDDIVFGSANADNLDGGTGNDTIGGGGGNDVLHGGGGDDALYGGNFAPTLSLGADAGTHDTATYDDARANYTIGVTTTNGFVTAFTDVTETGANKGAVDEGHDTLSGIEVLQFNDTSLDLTQAVQLFHGGSLVKTYSTIQAAVNDAAAGDTVLINGGIQSTFHESVTVSSGITLRGIGSVTIDGGSGGPAVTVTGGGAGQALTVDNIDLTGSSTYVALVDH